MRVRIRALVVVVIAIGAWFILRSPTTPVSSSIPQVSNEPNTQAPTALPSAPKAHEPLAPHSEEAQKLALLQEILSSRNDNDPRLDKEFLNLSEKTKELFRDKYNQLPAEKRNERGTIVFLLGKNLTSASDFQFLESVLKEPPCYNLEDCSRSSGTSDPHSEGMGSEITLAYPQVVSLKVIENYLKDKNNTHADLAKRAVETATTSPVKVVSTLAERMMHSPR